MDDAEKQTAGYGAVALIALTVAGAALHPILAIAAGVLSMAAAGALYVKARGTPRVRAVFLCAAIGVCLGAVVSYDCYATARDHQKQEEAKRQRAEAERRERLASLPSLHRDIEAAIAANNWEAAEAVWKKASEILPDDPQVARERQVIQPQMQRIRAAEAEDARRLAVVEGLTAARSIAKDSEKCDKPKDVGDAWGKLRQTKPSDKEYAEAKSLVRKLERCRLKMEKEMSTAVRSTMTAQRESLAQAAEEQFLDAGFDVRVRLGGDYKDRITFTWPLMSRVTVHQINKDGELLKKLQTAGFRRVTFADGFSESFYYDLEPDDENRGNEVMTAVGLGEPLSL